MTIAMPRRRFLAGLVGLVAAPAVIRVATLMPVKALAEIATMEEATAVFFAGGFITSVGFYEEVAAFLHRGESVIPRSVAQTLNRRAAMLKADGEWRDERARI